MIANKQGILTLPDFTTQENRHLFRAENVHSGRSMNKLRYIPRRGWDFQVSNSRKPERKYRRSE